MVTRKADTPQRHANRKYEEKNKDKRREQSGNFQTMIPRELFEEHVLFDYSIVVFAVLFVFLSVTYLFILKNSHKKPTKTNRKFRIIQSPMRQEAHQAYL